MFFRIIFNQTRFLKVFLKIYFYCFSSLVCITIQLYDWCVFDTWMKMWLTLGKRNKTLINNFMHGFKNYLQVTLNDKSVQKMYVEPFLKQIKFIIQYKILNTYYIHTIIFLIIQNSYFKCGQIFLKYIKNYQ